MEVRSGTYAYVGSAFGPGGVRARVDRHWQGGKARHWHIDYLRPQADLRQVWYTYDTVRRECTWAEVLQAFPHASIPLNGFGASDCDCAAHLIFFPEPPSLAMFRRRLKKAAPSHAPVRQHTLDRLRAREEDSK